MYIYEKRLRKLYSLLLPKRVCGTASLEVCWMLFDTSIVSDAFLIHTFGS